MKLLALLLLLGCAPLSTIGTYSRAPSICSRTNIMPYRIQIVLVDDMQPRHMRWIGWADYRGHVCTSWDLPGTKGRFGYFTDTSPDTTWGLWFQGWALTHGAKP